MTFMHLIRYRNPAKGNEYIFALSGDTADIELAITRAKERIANLALVAIDLMEKEIEKGIKHDPGCVIPGFPDWIKIYQEELANIGIPSIPCNEIIMYQTLPFEILDRK